MQIHIGIQHYTHSQTHFKKYSVACVPPVMRDTNACSLWVSIVYFLQASVKTNHAELFLHPTNALSCVTERGLCVTHAYAQQGKKLIIVILCNICWVCAYMCVCVWWGGGACAYK